jgi:spore germination protein
MLSKQTELRLVNGQLRNTLFGSDLARNGIRGLLEPLIRDPLISQRLKLTVVEGNAHDLLMKEYPQHPRTGKYIDRILEKEANYQTIPEVSLYHFTRDLLDDGIDPVAPIVKQGQNNVMINGIALFHEDRYAAKIEPEKSIIFSLLRGDFRQGEMVAHLQENGPSKQTKQTLAIISSLISKRDIQISRSEGNPFKAVFHIQLKGSILEYDGHLDMTKNVDRLKMETLISNYIKDEANQMFRHMQQHHVDSTGIGIAVRNSLTYQEWKKLDWESLYPQTEVTFNIKVKINSYGMFK